LWGWKSGGSRFWFGRKTNPPGALYSLTNKSQVIQTNVLPTENSERLLYLENGWVVETLHLKAGEKGLFQTVKPEESVLTILAIISGNTIEVARSVEQEFHPKFTTTDAGTFLEAQVDGEVMRYPVKTLKEKVDAAFVKQSTFVRSSVLKNLRK
jgi:hypothetical protein